VSPEFVPLPKTCQSRNIVTLTKGQHDVSKRVLVEAAADFQVADELFGFALAHLLSEFVNVLINRGAGLLYFGDAFRRASFLCHEKSSWGDGLPS